MAYKCDMCLKGRMVGRTSRHHKGVAGAQWLKRSHKTQKIFKPNLHSAKVMFDGVSKRMKLCVKCLRRVKEAMRLQKEVSKSQVAPISARI